jgi:parvulin-like peptidyl-prolyl isomerase
MKTAFRVVISGLLLMPVAGPAAEVIEQVLVKVNGDIITKTELEQRQITALRQKMNGQIDPELLKDDARLKEALAEVTPTLIVDAIDELLLLQMGKEKGYKLSDDQFKGWLSKIREEQNLQDDAKFQAALKQEGMGVEDLRKNVERQFIINQVQRDEVGAKLQITEEEARQYYLAHKQEFAEPATVTVREILIEVPTEKNQQGQPAINVAREDEARAKAEQARARVKAGEDFGKVAAEVSDSSSKANGGLIGPLPVDQLSTSLQQLFAKMKPGEITDPIRTPRGFQVLKLETMKSAEVPSFEGVRDLAADKVHSARQRIEFRKFMSRVRSQALIEWKNDELKKAYEIQIAAEAKAPQGAP